MRGPQVRSATGATRDGLERPRGDFFATHPDEVAKLLAVEAFCGVVWEPACGDGRMAEALLNGVGGVTAVVATDLYARGYGTPGIDFLGQDRLITDGVHHIVTNPPFEAIDAFARRAITLAPRGRVALFGRLAWLEGVARRDALWSVDPPARVWVCSRRPRLARNGGAYQSGLIAFAWFIWEHPYGNRGAPRLGWLP